MTPAERFGIEDPRLSKDFRKTEIKIETYSKE